MDIFGIGMNELVVILLLATIFLGPERLARVARDMGKFVRKLKSYYATFTDQLQSELEVIDDIKKTTDDLKKM